MCGGLGGDEGVGWALLHAGSVGGRGGTHLVCCVALQADFARQEKRIEKKKSQGSEEKIRGSPAGRPQHRR